MLRHTSTIALLTASVAAIRVDDDAGGRPHSKPHSQEQIRALEAEMAQMAAKVNALEGDGCNGFTPTKGPQKGKGGSCENWGTTFKWCYVDEDFEGGKQASASYPGKFFAACEAPPLQASLTPQSAGAVQAKAKAAVEKVEATKDAAEADVAKEAKGAAKQAAQNAKELVAVKKEKEDEAAAQQLGTRKETARLQAVAKVTTAARQEADRRAAEKAVLAKHAANKVDVAMELAYKTEMKKEAAIKAKNAAAKLAVDSEDEVERLTPLAKKAKDANLAAQEAMKAATMGEDDAVADHAVAERTAFVKLDEAHTAEDAATLAKTQAKETKDVKDEYQGIESDKKSEAKQAEERGLELLDRQDAVKEEKRIADEELAIADPIKKAASKKAKITHMVATKAAADAKQSEELSASERTIAEAAKEENHRASSKAFKTLYSKVQAEKKVIAKSEGEEKAMEEEATGATRHAEAATADEDANTTADDATTAAPEAAAALVQEDPDDPVEKDADGFPKVLSAEEKAEAEKDKAKKEKEDMDKEAIEKGEKTAEDGKKKESSVFGQEAPPDADEGGEETTVQDGDGLPPQQQIQDEQADDEDEKKDPNAPGAAEEGNADDSGNEQGDTPTGAPDEAPPSDGDADEADTDDDTPPEE